MQTLLCLRCCKFSGTPACADGSKFLLIDRNLRSAGDPALLLGDTHTFICALPDTIPFELCQRAKHRQL